MKTLLVILLSLLTFSVYSQCPKINSILVDACGSSEGTDEFFIFTTGSRNIYVDSINVDFPNTALPNYCNSGCGTNTLINNTTYLNSLNTTAGCTLFKYSNIIPSNTRVVVFTGNPPTTTLNFNVLCGTGEEIYVIFTNNTSTTGRFANYSAGSGIRTLNVKFGSCVDSVKYDKVLVKNANGAYIDFDNSGNASYLVSPTCNYTDVLPLEILKFKGVFVDNRIELTWGLKDYNNEQIYVEKSINGKDFNVIDSTINNFYSDYEVLNKNYYRLRISDIFSETIVVDTKNKSKILINKIDIYSKEIYNLENFIGVYYEVYDNGEVIKKIKF